MEYLEHKVIGQGEVRVVFVNGFRMHFDSWDKVYPCVAQSCSVFLFNRFGVGLSPKAQVPQVGNQVVECLRNILLQAGVKPPYVLVAHSLGGVFANLYARLFPHEVLGVVFVESPHPLEIIEQKKLKGHAWLNAVNDGFKSIEKLFDRFKFSEDECIIETLHALEAAGPFPNIPIVVVSGAKKMPLVPQSAFELHAHFQLRLLEYSSQSKHFICERSGHFPQITESEWVLAAIDCVVRLVSRPAEQ